MPLPAAPTCYCVPRVAAMLRTDSGRSRPIRECIAEARDMIRADPTLHECDAYVIHLDADVLATAQSDPRVHAFLDQATKTHDRIVREGRDL